MTLKIAVNSVIRGASSWLSLIVASVVLMVVVTLSIGLIVAGVAAGGDAQQAYASMGGVALGFTVLTGFASFRLVVGTCVRLQRRDVALWQIVGVLPRTARLILIVEILLVTALSALLGALVSEAVWPWYAGFVATSGLPRSDVLTYPIPVVAMITGVATTAVVSLMSGLGSARQIARADVVTAVRPSETTQSSPRHSRVLFVVVTVLLIAGTVTLYFTIGHVSPVTDADDLVGVLSAYPGMGLLVCLFFAMICGPVVRGLVALIRAIGLGGTPGFLASREAAARPRLTQALVMPISLAAAAIGMMTSWIHLVTTVMAARAPGSGSVSAPPRQMALLLGVRSLSPACARPPSCWPLHHTDARTMLCCWCQDRRRVWYAPRPSWRPWCTQPSAWCVPIPLSRSTTWPWWLRCRQDRSPMSGPRHLGGRPVQWSALGSPSP